MSNSSSNKKSGGRVPLDPNCQLVQDIARWAVNEYSKEHPADCLLYENTFKAESEVVDGVLYYLGLTAMNNRGVMNNYAAIVLDKPWEKYRKLESFKELLQENAPIAIPN